MLVTIDGPAGTGKTTVAKKVARRLHFEYFDTGAMYRSVALLLLEKKISPSDIAQVEKVLEGFSFRIDTNGCEKRYFVGEREVTEEIRSPKVTQIVSAVSALPRVRQLLSEMQRAFAAKGDAVFEGRDMGSAVFPQAEIKIFLTASPEVRAQRRLEEMIAKKLVEPNAMDREQCLRDLMQRDELDSTRKLAPLRCPEGACQIDTSDLTIDQVVDLILKYITEKKL